MSILFVLPFICCVVSSRTGILFLEYVMTTAHAFLLESLEHHLLLLKHINSETIHDELRVLFSTTEESFPFVIRNVIRGDRENTIILSGVADTRKRGRHFVRIEYRIDSRMGTFF